MKMLRLLILIFFFMPTFVCFAQQPTGTRIGVVDLDQITDPVMQKLRLQVEALLKKYHAEFFAYEQKLRAENQELVEGQKKLDPQDSKVHDAFNQRKNAFEQKVLDVQRKAENRRQRLSQQHKKVSDDFRHLLVSVIKEVRLAQKLDVVMSQSVILDWDAALDITAFVQEKLNQKLPTIALTIQVDENDG